MGCGDGSTTPYEVTTSAGHVRVTVPVAGVFRGGRIVCEASADPVGVELAGCAKNAAALAAGATESQGLNAAGMAAADIFGEVLALAERSGGEARTFIGRAGTGDLVATALAPTSRNRSAGELLAQGVPAAEIPERLGQAVEALETVPLLARAIERAGVSAPITSALARLIEGTLPLDEWVALVRVSQPEPVVSNIVAQARNSRFDSIHGALQLGAVVVNHGRGDHGARGEND